MTEYILVAIIMVFLYLVLIRNRPAPKTEWETLPTFEKYQSTVKTKNTEGHICCQYCGQTEILKKALNDKKENPNGNKYYHACSQCKVILWRSEMR